MENEERKQSSKRLALSQLNQVESDFAMAMELQEQERALTMLETIDSDSEEEYDDDEDETETASGSEIDNDYEYFESLDAEVGFLERQDSNDEEEEEDMEEDEIDPDELSYEELIALGEFIGVEKRGLKLNEISSFLSLCKFDSSETKSGTERCVVCQVEYHEGESVAVLPCEHPYHSDCITKWLQINKICPICSAEISSSSSSSKFNSSRNL